MRPGRRFNPVRITPAASNPDTAAPDRRARRRPRPTVRNAKRREECPHNAVPVQATTVASSVEVGSGSHLLAVDVNVRVGRRDVEAHSADVIRRDVHAAGGIAGWIRIIRIGIRRRIRVVAVVSPVVIGIVRIRDRIAEPQSVAETPARAERIVRTIERTHVNARSDNNARPCIRVASPLGPRRIDAWDCRASPFLDTRRVLARLSATLLTRLSAAVLARLSTLLARLSAAILPFGRRRRRLLRRSLGARAAIGLLRLPRTALFVRIAGVRILRQSRHSPERQRDKQCRCD